MPIRRLLEGSDLAASEINNLSLAFDAALNKLHLVDRNDPITEMVARKIIEMGKVGGNPNEIALRAIKALGVRE